MSTQILVVDDSPLERRRVEHLLEIGLSDTEVTLAFDGGMALEQVTTQPPDLIVSDMRMPQMNGLELVQALRNADCHIPIVLMTSFGSEDVAMQALRAGASGYVPKRRLEFDLIKTINDLLVLSRKRQDHRRVIGTLSTVEYQFTLDNNPALVTPLVSHLMHQMNLMNILRGSQVTRIGVALQEALSNAIFHGNLGLNSELRQEDERHYYELAEARRLQSPYADRQVKVVAKLSTEDVRFTITDSGSGFDPMKILDPTSKVNMDRIGGRGLLLIRSFMDHVSFNSLGNEITMSMELQSPVVEAVQARPEPFVDFIEKDQEFSLIACNSA